MVIETRLSRSLFSFDCVCCVVVLDGHMAGYAPVEITADPCAPKLIFHDLREIGLVWFIC